MLVTVLGHKGMLGNAVCKFFRDELDWNVITLDERFPGSDFESSLLNNKSDFIINCIGSIPQKKPSTEEYVLLNENLPKFLDSIGKRIIHPSTDCEFNGAIPFGQEYNKHHRRDANDEYGKSKAEISYWIENESNNTKIIRTSIVGHQISGFYSLLDWFLNQTEEVNGYTDQYWNGITTLEWAKHCSSIINDWENTLALTQLSSPECISKHDLLTIFKDIYAKDISIVPTVSGNAINKCLQSDKILPSIVQQMLELKQFYGK